MNDSGFDLDNSVSVVDTDDCIELVDDYVEPGDDRVESNIVSVNQERTKSPHKVGPYATKTIPENGNVFYSYCLLLYI